MSESNNIKMLYYRETLNSIGQFTILKTQKILRDASNNVMDIKGTVRIPVRPVNTEGSVDLLGRNFMKSYKKVTFDFENDRMMFNNTCCKGLSLGRKQCIQLVNDCVIPARSETIMTMQCNDRNGHLLGDFEA